MISELLEPRLADLLAEAGVTDVLLAGGEAAWVSRGAGVEPRSNPFASDADLDRVAVDLIAAGGRQLDPANPFADVVLGEFRVHAALRSACTRVTQLSIRYLGSRDRSLAQLASVGMFDEVTLTGLRQILAARQNFLVCGPTGAGKTTLLRAMLAECGAERVITIEDLPELRLGGNCVELLTRAPNIEGRGEVSLSRLLVEALRMRPDRLVVGELRSRELLVLLQAMNTGHAGSGATLHANSLATVPARLRAIALGAGIEPRLLDSLVASAIDWVIQVGHVGELGNFGDVGQGAKPGGRQIMAVGRFVQGEGGLEVRQVTR